VDQAALAAELVDDLRARGDAARADHDRGYLKVETETLGVGVPAVRSVARAFSDRHPLDRRELLALVDDLWTSGIHDARMAAVELLDGHGALLEPDDLDRLGGLIRTAGTWALVDGLAASVGGPLVERHPDPTPVLDRWVTDPSFWVRRAALLVHLVALREGRGDFDRFGRDADALLDETEFFIRKAIGWVLRDTARRRPALVVAWLEPRAARASGVTWREAVKPLGPEDRARLEQARHAGPGGA
jgi:3-methyladenine DNA glycosylase AlkD